VVAPRRLSSQMHDLRWAAAKMTGVVRRAFQAEMTLKYGHGSARFVETRLGWSRAAVEVGWAEQRTGSRGWGAHAAGRGRNRGEEPSPEAATALRELAEAHAPQAPTFRTTRAYPRLTAQAAGEALRAQGSSQPQLPSASTRAEGLTRRGYRVRQVSTATPQKKIPETEASFAKRKKSPGGDGRPPGQPLAQGLSSDGPYRRVLARRAYARRVQSACP
jgi:hypothetical protein